jgi:hypothetical protein
MSRRGGQTGKGSLRWRIEVKPDPKEIDAAFKRLGQRLADWRPALRRLVPVILRGQSQIFASKGAALGEPWSPVRAAYERRKARRGFGREPMRRTGKLRRDLISQAGVLSVGKKRLEFGTRLPYARAVHFGQRRRVLGWTSGMESEALEIMNGHARQLLEQTSAQLKSAGG